MKKTILSIATGFVLAFSATAQAFERVDCQIDPSNSHVVVPAGIRADEAIPTNTFSLVKTGMVKGQETYQLTDSIYGTAADIYFLKQENQKLSFSADAYYTANQHRTILLSSANSGISYQTHGGTSAYGGQNWSVTVQYRCVVK